MGEPLTVRVDPAVYRHEKTMKASEALGLHPAELVRHLTLLWAVAKRHGGTILDLTGADRSVTEAKLVQLSREIGYGADVTALVGTLLKVRYLELQGRRYVVHDWTYWQGSKTAKASSVSAGTPDVQEDLPPGLRGTNWFGHLMWWFVDGFGFRDYVDSPADRGYFKQHGGRLNIPLIAETYIAVATGVWGDDFDKRALTARHAVNKAGAFSMFKRRRQVDTIIHPTEIGARYHPTGGQHRGGLAGGDAGAAPGAAGQTDPSASGPRSYKLDEHPKYGRGPAGAPGRTAHAGSVSR